jgi:hypothetical protein
MDPQLKFKTGVCKGQPLDSVGVPYRIIRRNGEDVAYFNNGNMARFYRDTAEPVPVNPPTCAKCGKLFLECVCAKDAKGHAPWPHGPIALDEIEFTLTPPGHIPVFRKTIGVYKTRDGHRPQHPCEPLYCVLEGSKQLYNVGRDTVGRGLREYLWLYDILRSFGRGRFAALLEAEEIYFQ